MVRINAARPKDAAGEQAETLGAVLPDDRGAHYPAIDRMAPNEEYRQSMSRLPRHQCPAPGCRELIDHGAAKCPAHRRTRQLQQDETASLGLSFDSGFIHTLDGRKLPVSEIEIEKKDKSQDKPPLLPFPKDAESSQ